MDASLHGAILEIPPWQYWSSNSGPPRDRGHCVVGSLTGAVSSQRVTEEHEGWLSTVGHRTVSVMAQASLTARGTSRAGTKVGHSDPVVLYGRAIAQRIKGTPGITG